MWKNWQAGLRRTVMAGWLILLIAPSALTYASVLSWDVSPWYLVSASVWLIISAYLLLDRRLFLLLTYPLVVFGIATVSADILRNVNIVELVVESQAYSSTEIVDAISPYRYWIALTALIVAALLMLLWKRAPKSSASPYAVPAVIILGAALIIMVPAMVWVRAWPMNLISVGIAAANADNETLLSLLPFANIDPRDHTSSWGGHRAIAPSSHETYVLVIGEAIRSDRLPDCGGRPEVWQHRADALIFCNVISGSSSTHTSVPLLISRDIPGSSARVPGDTSFLNAWQSVGFDTYWISAHDRRTAWPDADHEQYLSGGLDRKLLIPALDRALAAPSPRKLIVLHAYNAHFLYSQRYDHSSAPFPVRRDIMGGLPTRATLPEWWNDYDNAVHESMQFIDAVLKRLDRQPGQAFLLFTPDHGENMLDDDRDLLYHALSFPTRWDVHVPAVIWANTDWRNTFPDKWKLLTDNTQRPLMHMDFVPTLLGAAGIGYTEPRSLPVDLTKHVVGERKRIVQKRLGEAVDADALKSPAGIMPGYFQQAACRVIALGLCQYR